MGLNTQFRTPAQSDFRRGGSAGEALTQDQFQLTGKVNSDNTRRFLTFAHKDEPVLPLPLFMETDT